ncbi:MAG: hypothetical protein ACLUEC_12770 [Coprococcus sp.]
MKKTYILSCAAIIISIISMTISIIEMGTEAVTTPDGSISDCVSKESQLLVESKENMVVQLKSEVPETELIKHGTEYVVEKVVIENSGEKYYFIEMFVNENPYVKQVSAEDFEIISEYQIPLDISRRG